MPAERPSPEHVTSPDRFAASSPIASACWRQAAQSRLSGIQVPAAAPWPPYVLDFYAELRLVIELDGGQHHDAAGLARDRCAQRIWSARGWRCCVSVIWTYCRIWTAF